MSNLTTLAALVLMLPALANSQQMRDMPGMKMSVPETASYPSLPALAKPLDLLTEAARHPPLTLENLLTSALIDSPALSQTRALITRAEALARQAGLYPNPTLGYQGDQIRGGSFGGGEQGAFVAQTIPLGGKLALRRRSLEAEAATTRTSTEIQQARIRADVTQAFYSALAAQQSAHIRRRLHLVAQDAVQTAHQLANIGQADAPDLLTAEIEQEQAELADEQAQRLFLARFRTLAILAGTPTQPLSPLLADLDDTHTIDPSRLFDDNPLIHQAQAEILSAEARLSSARREVVPDLQLKAGEQYNFEQLGSSPTASAANKNVGPQTFASAAISIPLWNRNQGNVQAAQADLEIARQGLRRLQLYLRSQTEPLFADLATAQSRATRYRTSILPRATRAVQLHEQKYNQMGQSYTVVLMARRNLLELQLQYTESLADIWRIQTAMTNSLLSGSLSTVYRPSQFDPPSPMSPSID